MNIERVLGGLCNRPEQCCGRRRGSLSLSKLSITEDERAQGRGIQSEEEIFEFPHSDTCATEVERIDGAAAAGFPRFAEDTKEHLGGSLLNQQSVPQAQLKESATSEGLLDEGEAAATDQTVL